MLNLTASQLVDILKESNTAREIVANMVISGYLIPLKIAIEATVRENSGNKIAAIKAVRELGKATDIYPLFPVAWNRSEPADGRLGLADSKNLVEYVARAIGHPYESYV